MSTKGFKQLKDDPSLRDVKKWSSEFAEFIAMSFVGHEKSSTMVVVSVLFEVMCDHMKKENQDDVMKTIKDTKLSAEDAEILHNIISEMAEDKDIIESLPSGKDAFSISPELGHCIALIGIIRSQQRAVEAANELKIMMASTLLSADEKANSLNEIGHLFGYENMTTEARKDVRNFLKAGTLDVVKETSPEDLDDTCDKLFG